jgi:hypothetical protein
MEEMVLLVKSFPCIVKNYATETVRAVQAQINRARTAWKQQAKDGTTTSS